MIAVVPTVTNGPAELRDRSTEYSVAPMEGLQPITMEVLRGVALTFTGIAGARETVVTEISAAAELPAVLKAATR